VDVWHDVFGVALGAHSTLWPGGHADPAAELPDGADLALAALLVLAGDPQIVTRMQRVTAVWALRPDNLCLPTTPDLAPTLTQLESFAGMYEAFVRTPHTWLGQADRPALTIAVAQPIVTEGSGAHFYSMLFLVIPCYSYGIIFIPLLFLFIP
jgi:hypothetical protein